MRIARFAKGDGVAYGVVEGAGSGVTIAELHGHPFGVDPGGVRLTGHRYPLAEVRLLAPVLPSKVVGAGRNYASHALEMNGEPPAEPVLFLKPSTSVTGPGDAIKYPVKITERVDFEGELAVIISRLCRGVPRERADEVIFGYTCANDVTARDLQARDGQWTRAKGFDTFCPLGPWIETGTNSADLELTTAVNGAVRQQARTSELLWDVPSLIAYVSQVMTLLPGDVLLTGTPAGVGPLTDGDEVSVIIETIGTLTNRVVIGDLEVPGGPPGNRLSRQGAPITPYHFLVTADPQALSASPRRGTRGGRAIALIALALGLAGFAISMTAVAIQLLPRHFTAAQQRQIENWEIASRWQTMAAGAIFPASVSYQLPAQLLQDAAPLNLDALRIGIARQSGCTTSAITAAAAAVLRREGCQAVLRATYVDATRSYVTTVGVAVLPTAAAAAAASAGLAPPLAVAHRAGDGSQLAAGVQVVRFGGTAAALYDYSRQISASFPDGPYLIMYAAGYADSRPRVPVASDRYSDDELTDLALGVAQSVASRLAAQPAPPHCPGAPGC